jgi:hypothetical protein
MSAKRTPQPLKKYKLKTQHKAKFDPKKKKCRKDQDPEEEVHWAYEAKKDEDSDGEKSDGEESGG